MDPTRGLPPKKDVLDELLARGSARIFLDPRREGVVVPKSFSNQAELVLRVGYSLKPAIIDLLVTDESVSCTLSFNRTPCWCKLPWSAVFAVVSDVGSRGVVWPDDVPIESQLLKPSTSKPKLASVSSTPEGVGRPRRAPRRDRDGDKIEEPQVVAQTRLPRLEVAPEPARRPLQPPPFVTSERQVASEKGLPQSSETKKKPKRELPPYLRVVK